MKYEERVVLIIVCLILLFPVTLAAQHKHPGQTQTVSPGMEKGMMEASHHRLMMAYVASMTAFASALNEQTNAQMLDDEVARATVVELRHNLDAMEALHQKHMQMMTPEMHSKMQMMMKTMDKERGMLKEHVTVLETAVQADKPDAAQLRTHATALVNQLDKISKMHGSKTKKATSMKM